MRESKFLSILNYKRVNDDSGVLKEPISCNLKPSFAPHKICDIIVIRMPK